jgi:tyrosyl-tRNA synthetase
MNKDDVNELFSRGVGSFVDPDGSFREKLEKKARGEYPGDIVIKLGVDPTRPDIHLGHAVILRRLRQFQELGCKVIFLVGNFTAQIGDPSGKSKVRPEISVAEIENNMRTFVEQVGKILRTDDPKLFSWIANGDWFTGVTDLNLPDDYKIEMEVGLDGKSTKIPIAPNSFIGKAIAFEQTRMQVKQLGLKDRISVVTFSSFLWALKHITHSRLIDRDMFQERITKGEELYMHEMMYPVLQGIDSVVLTQIYGSCDLEIGGTDQTFNMLIGRDIMKANNYQPQAVMALEILVGTDGKEKMSKSLDNYIAITESPREMFGKVMSVSDDCMRGYFTLATYTPTDEIDEMMSKIEKGKLHPKDAKLRLAREIVSIYHGEPAAKEAQEDFVNVFSNKDAPKDVEVVKAAKGTQLVDILLSQNTISSKTDWRRLVSDNAVTIMESGKLIDSAGATLEESITLKVGKHRFLKIEVL